MFALNNSYNIRNYSSIRSGPESGAILLYLYLSKPFNDLVSGFGRCNVLFD